MPREKYEIHLTELQRKELQELVSKGRAKAREIKHANVLLLSEQGKTYKEIEKALNVSHQTILTIRKRFTLENLKSALVDRPRPGVKSKLDDKGEAYLISLSCSNPPEGREIWTMQMLADKLIELKVVDSISDETVRRHLKKTRLNRGKRNSGVSAK